MHDAAIYSVFPYELSLALLLLKEREENERVRVDRAERDERSRYIPPPLSAEHEEKEE